MSSPNTPMSIERFHTGSSRQTLSGGTVLPGQAPEPPTAPAPAPVTRTWDVTNDDLNRFRTRGLPETIRPGDELRVVPSRQELTRADLFRDISSGFKFEADKMSSITRAFIIDAAGFDPTEAEDVSTDHLIETFSGERMSPEAFITRLRDTVFNPADMDIPIQAKPGLASRIVGWVGRQITGDSPKAPSKITRREVLQYGQQALSPLAQAEAIRIHIAGNINEQRLRQLSRDELDYLPTYLQALSTRTDPGILKQIADAASDKISQTISGIGATLSEGRNDGVGTYLRFRKDIPKLDSLLSEDGFQDLRAPELAQLREIFGAPEDLRQVGRQITRSREQYRQRQDIRRMTDALRERYDQNLVEEIITGGISVGLDIGSQLLVAKAGGIVGGPAGAATASITYNASRFSGEFEDQLIYDYGVTPDMASAISAPTAVAYAWLGKVQAGKFAELSKSKIFVDAFKENYRKEIIKSGIAKSGTAYLFEVGVEGLQKSAEEAAKQFLRAIGEEGLQDYGIAESTEAVLNEMIEAAKGMLIPVGVAGAAGNVRRGMQTGAIARQTEANARRAAAALRSTPDLGMAIPDIGSETPTSTLDRENILEGSARVLAEAVSNPDSAPETVKRAGDMLQRIVNSPNFVDRENRVVLTATRDAVQVELDQLNRALEIGGFADPDVANPEAVTNGLRFQIDRLNPILRELNQRISALDIPADVATSSYYNKDTSTVSPLHNSGLRLLLSRELDQVDIGNIETLQGLLSKAQESVDSGESQDAVTDNTLRDMLEPELSVSPSSRVEGLMKIANRVLAMDFANMPRTLLDPATTDGLGIRVLNTRAIMASALRFIQKSAEWQAYGELDQGGPRTVDAGVWRDALTRAVSDVAQDIDLERFRISPEISQGLAVVKAVQAWGRRSPFRDIDALTTLLKPISPLAWDLTTDNMTSMRESLTALTPGQLTELTKRAADGLFTSYADLIATAFDYGAGSRGAQGWLTNTLTPDNLQHMGLSPQSVILAAEVVRLLETGDDRVYTRAWEQAFKELVAARQPATGSLEMAYNIEEESEAVRRVSVLSAVRDVLYGTVEQQDAAVGRIQDAILGTSPEDSAYRDQNREVRQAAYDKYKADREAEATQDRRDWSKALDAAAAAKPNKSGVFTKMTTHLLGLQDMLGDIFRFVGDSKQRQDMVERLRTKINMATRTEQRWMDARSKELRAAIEVIFGEDMTAALNTPENILITRLRKVVPGTAHLGDDSANLNLDQVLYQIAVLEMPWYQAVGNEQIQSRVKTLPELRSLVKGVDPRYLELIPMFKAQLATITPEVANKVMQSTGLEMDVTDGPNYFPARMGVTSEGFESMEWSVPVMPSFLNPKVAHNNDLDWRHGFTSVMYSHMLDASRYLATVDLSNELRQGILTREFMGRMEQVFGQSYTKAFRSKLTDTIKGTPPVLPGEGTGWVNAARGAAAVYGLAYNLNSVLTQLSSFPMILLESERIGGLTSTLKEAMTNPRGLFEGIRALAESPERDIRLKKGYSEAMRNAIQFTEGRGMLTDTLDGRRNVIAEIINMGMRVPALGDMSVSVLMGGSIYNNLYHNDPVISNLPEAERKQAAVDRTYDIIESLYQSSQMKDLPDWLRRGSVGKVIGQFTSAQARMSALIVRNLRQAYAEKDPVKRTLGLVRVAGSIYAVRTLMTAVQTAAQAMWSYLFDDDDEERMMLIITGGREPVGEKEEIFYRWFVKSAFDAVFRSASDGIPLANWASDFTGDWLRSYLQPVDVSESAGAPATIRVVEEVVTGLAEAVDSIVTGALDEDVSMQDAFAEGVVEGLGGLNWTSRMFRRWLRAQKRNRLVDPED